MCKHFADSATNPCADDRAEPPVHKEGANFCDFFRPAADSFRAGRHARQAHAKSNLDALFGGSARPDAAADEEGGESDAAREARRRLDELFG